MIQETPTSTIQGLGLQLFAKLEFCILNFSSLMGRKIPHDYSECILKKPTKCWWATPSSPMIYNVELQVLVYLYFIFSINLFICSSLNSIVLCARHCSRCWGRFRKSLLDPSDGIQPCLHLDSILLVSRKVKFCCGFYLCLKVDQSWDVF